MAICSPKDRSMRHHDRRTGPEPARLPDGDVQEGPRELLAGCPPLIVLAKHVSAFAELLTTRCGADLEDWMTAVEARDLPALHAFAPRAAQGPRRRRRRAEPALQQRTHRGHQHQSSSSSAF